MPKHPKMVLCQCDQFEGRLIYRAKNMPKPGNEALTRTPAAGEVLKVRVIGAFAERLLDQIIMNVDRDPCATGDHAEIGWVLFFVCACIGVCHEEIVA